MSADTLKKENQRKGVEFFGISPSHDILNGDWCAEQPLFERMNN